MFAIYYSSQIHHNRCGGGQDMYIDSMQPLVYYRLIVWSWFTPP